MKSIALFLMTVPVYAAICKGIEGYGGNILTQIVVGVLLMSLRDYAESERNK